MSNCHDYSFVDLILRASCQNIKIPDKRNISPILIVFTKGYGGGIVIMSQRILKRVESVRIECIKSWFDLR